MWIHVGIFALLALREWNPDAFSSGRRRANGRLACFFFCLPLPRSSAWRRPSIFAQFVTPHADSWRVAGEGADTFFGILWVVALGEELFFRGFIQRALENQWRNPDIRDSGFRAALRRRPPLGPLIPQLAARVGRVAAGRRLRNRLLVGRKRPLFHAGARAGGGDLAAIFSSELSTSASQALGCRCPGDCSAAGSGKFPLTRQNFSILRNRRPAPSYINSAFLHLHFK